MSSTCWRGSRWRRPFGSGHGGCDERAASLADLEEERVDLEEDARVEEGAKLLGDRRKLFTFGVVLLLGIVAIYVVFPKIAGFEDSLEKMDDATWYWIVVAIGFNIAAFGAYVALFKGILSGNVGEKVHERLDFRASYQITMAGLAATRIFSAAGAGGLVVTYWALRKAGMERRRAACRMVAFLALTYVFYLAALIIFGVLLRTGVLPGSNPSGGTIVPAAVAGVVLVLLLLVALIPGDVERRLSGVLAALSTRGADRQPAREGPGDARHRGAHGDRIRAASAPRLPSQLQARSGSGRRTSGSCGRASRRTAPTSRSACSSRASSSAWRPT